MKLTIPKQVSGILTKLEKAGFEAYIVGGAVRDILMDKTVTDWDFTTNATPEEIVKIFKKDEPFYDNQFGTVGIPSKNEDLKPFEITTFRTEEGYSDARRPDKVSWGKTLQEDLKRRDFTVNAMALSRSRSTADYQLIDLFNGKKDLNKKIIRAVGNPQERFAEDALRLMRAVRIASELNFKIEPKTLEAIKGNAALINKIAKERVRDELIKILKSQNPYKGIVLLRESGLQEQILPEAEKMYGVEQKSPGRHHIYDVGTHALMSLKHCPSDNPIVLFAAYIHDVGKPQTYKKLESGTITFYNHEVVGTKIAKRIADRLRFSKKDTDKLIKLVRWHQFTLDEYQSDKAIRRFIRKVGIENIEDMLAIRIGDRVGSGARSTSWRFEEFKKRLIEVQKQPFTVHDLKITGNDVMKELGIGPGPEIGRVLNKLFEEVENKNLPNDKKALLKKIRELRN